MNYGKLIADSLTDHPDEWEMKGRYTIRHIPTGWEYWVANGPSSFRLYSDAGPTIPFGQKGRAYRAYEKWAYAIYSKQLLCEECA